MNHLFLLEGLPEPETKVGAVAATRQGGGVVATAMVTCARLGLRAAYVGKVGADALGREVGDELAREGVDVSGLVRDPAAPTRFTIGLVERGSGRRTLVRDAGRPARLEPGDLSPATATAGRVLHLDGYEGPAALRAARWAREAGIPVSLDAEEATECREELCRLADILIVSDPFAEMLTGATRLDAVLDGLAARGPALVGVTLGAGGAAVRHRGETVVTPAIPGPVLDTTGAGDVFHGAFLAGLLWGWPLGACLELANAVAGLKCRRLGGRAGIPSLAETRTFLADLGRALPSAEEAASGVPGRPLTETTRRGAP
jgi:sugar/nucleoside kinase (ribokinase family)